MSEYSHTIHGFVLTIEMVALLIVSFDNDLPWSAMIVNFCSEHDILTNHLAQGDCDRIVASVCREIVSMEAMFAYPVC
jgi:hypothetical protein